MRLAGTESVPSNPIDAYAQLLSFRPAFEADVFLVNGDHNAGRLDDCGSNLAFRQAERLR
jgi:hypothetical protein